MDRRPLALERRGIKEGSDSMNTTKRHMARYRGPSQQADH